jgi:AcrR family transcriptional regulator
MQAPPHLRDLTPRQQELRDALVDLVLAEGFRHLGVDEVAARLSCSKRTLYALAGSREQLATLAVREFFRRATEQVEEALVRVRGPAQRVSAYLTAVAAALAPASRAFHDDVARFAPAHEIYERNTEAAARRVRELLEEGRRAGAFRATPTAFIAEVVTSTMRRISSGEIEQATGMTDAEAYAELGRLVLAHVAVPPARRGDGKGAYDPPRATVT